MRVLSRGAGIWIGVGGLFLAMVGLSNWLLPIPDANDFRGLARLCLLMQEGGVGYSVNNNWGFGLPLATCGLTHLTGDLLLAQRIISAAFCALALVFADRLMRNVLRVESVEVRSSLLAVLVLSPWMNETLVSVHLDIVPIALFLAGLSLLGAKRPLAHLLGGFLAAAGYWFRFHFLLFAVSYLPLLIIHRWGDRQWRRGVPAGVGLALGLALPTLLTLAVFDVPMVSNAKAIFSLRADFFSWSVASQLALDDIGFLDVLQAVNWVKVFIQEGMRLVGDGPVPLLFTLFVIHLGEVMRNLGEASDPPGFVGWLRRALRSLKDESVLILFSVAVLWVALLVIRSNTVRLEAILWFIAIPAMAGIWIRAKPGIRRGLIIGLCVVCIGKTPLQLYNSYARRDAQNRIEAEVSSVIPAEVRRERPESVLSLVEPFYNHESGFWLFNPILKGGWMVTWPPFREAFGVLDLEDWQRRRNIPGLEFIILSRTPRYVFEEYDESLLSVWPVLYTGDEVIILRRNPTD